MSNNPNITQHLQRLAADYELDEYASEVCGRAAAEIERLRLAVLAYNGVLRSAYSIAEREGRETNWKAFFGVVKRTIDEHHATFVEAMRAQVEPETGPGGAVS